MFPTAEIARFDTMDNTKFQTTDLRLGAYLRMLGYKISSILRVGNRIIFHFDKKEGCQTDINRYYNKESTVEPLTYMSSLGEMRDMVGMASRGEAMMAGGKDNGKNGKPTPQGD